MAETFIELAGGVDKFIAKARSAFVEKKYNLSAKRLCFPTPSLQNPRARRRGS
jgi:hypothetical protein